MEPKKKPKKKPLVVSGGTKMLFHSKFRGRLCVWRPESRRTDPDWSSQDRHGQSGSDPPPSNGNVAVASERRRTEREKSKKSKTKKTKKKKKKKRILIGSSQDHQPIRKRPMEPTRRFDGGGRCRVLLFFSRFLDLLISFSFLFSFFFSSSSGFLSHRRPVRRAPLFHTHTHTVRSRRRRRRRRRRRIEPPPIRRRRRLICFVVFFFDGIGQFQVQLRASQSAPFCAR